MKTKYRSRFQKLAFEGLERRNLLTTLFVTSGDDAGPGTFRAAVEEANVDSAVDEIVFDSVSLVELDDSIEYTGQQHLSIDGNGATIDTVDGDEGLFDLFVSSGGADLSLLDLSFVDGADGVFVDVPADATGKLDIELDGVHVRDSQFFGVHVSDQVNNSKATIRISIIDSVFENNGATTPDFDGVRVDEGGAGSIFATIVDSHFDGNGGDGLELDERGRGDVDLRVHSSSFDNNGFSDPDDLDDGLDIDEGGLGSIKARIVDATFNNNDDEGLDLDEENHGHIQLFLRHVQANNNLDEGIKVDEKFEVVENPDGSETPVSGSSGGDVYVSFINVEASGSVNQEGIAITEEGRGNMRGHMRHIVANNNADEGIDVSESGVGVIQLRLRGIVANDNDNDGIQMEELGQGNLFLIARRIEVKRNDDFGIRLIQEEPGNGRLFLRRLDAEDNGDGELELERITV